MKKVQRLGPGLFRAAISIQPSSMTINCYLLADRREAYVVDTAWRPGGDTEHLSALLAEGGVRPQEVSGIILTHCHRDHVGHLHALQELTSAPAFLHADERYTLDSIADEAGRREAVADWLSSHGVPSALAVEWVRSFGWHDRIAIKSPHWLEDGQEIRIGSMSWRVIHSPGHSPGHICLFQPGFSLLIVGDHILSNQSTNISVRPDFPFDPLGGYLLSLKRLASLGIRRSLPGHGETFDDLELLINHQLPSFERRLSATFKALAGRSASCFEIASAARWVHQSKSFDELPANQRHLAFGKTMAFLECLQGRGLIRRVEGSLPIVWTQLETPRTPHVPKST